MEKFDDIKALVSDISSRGATTVVTFQCPRSGRQAQAAVEVNTSSNNNALAKSDTDGIFRVLIAFVVRNLHRFLPDSISSRSRFLNRFVAREISRGGGSAAGNTEKAGRAAKGPDKLERKAAVEAFSQVRDEFVRDGTSGEWIHRDAQQVA